MRISAFKGSRSVWTYSAVLLLAFAFCYLNACSPAATSVSKEEAEKWVNEGDWRQGLSMQPDTSIDAQRFYTQFHAHPDWWKKAVEFMKRSDLDTLALGKYPIVDTNVFATISEYIPKDVEKSLWEAHHNYADIQAVLGGVEKIGKADTVGLTVVHPYNPAHDAANYDGPGEYLTAKPGTFFIFFPGQAHRPGLKADAGDTTQVRKLVIKMRIPQ